VQERAVALGFGALERTKFVTAASELARNTLVHGGGGQMSLSVLIVDGRTGLRLEFVDKGPGIADVALAMTDGYTTARSLGLGLGGAKRLVNEFEISSRPGDGTVVRITQWKRR
jgi:serine/threonine-protein kinase RsbT